MNMQKLNINQKHKLLNYALFVITFVLLSGCVASNPVNKGEVSRDPADRWIPPRHEERYCVPVLSGEEIIDQEWSEHTGPWAIAELVDVALRNNPITHVSWENARTTAYNWKASQSTLYPEVGLTEELLFQKITGSAVGDIVSSADVTSSVGGLAVSRAAATPSGLAAAASSSGSSIGSGNIYNQWTISTLAASYLLFDFGGRSASIEAARQSLISANWTHNRNIQAVILSVLTNYYKHLEAKALFAAKEEDIKDANENLNAAQGQFSAGVKAKLDVLLSKSNLANTQLDLEKDRGLVKTTLGQLATSLGMPANMIFSVEDLPEEVEMEKINDSMDELIAIAKVERPDLASAEANWNMMQENVTIAWSLGMPTLTANANIIGASNAHHSLANSRQYNGFLTLNVPIFTGFLHVNQTRSAIANANATYANWKLQEEGVILDVVTSYYDYKTAVETVKFSNKYFEYTNEAYDVAFASYKSGVGTILDLLAAQSALSNARAQKIQAKTQWITSITNVAYATGQL